ncbi:MAG: hypothetical protein METHP_02156 [Methanoregula sp. SKADARSKE-2]|nr:MAG: hypothetical protein METHP_01827 [Methanoregula sp. SKADARSKE-2]WML68521.1 MAG: hypothetical protein METHP_02156 [Methanoregula sp. SKADARSKE-2]
MMLPTPVPGHQFNLMGIRFVEGTIIDYQYSFVSPEQPLRFLIQRPSVVRLAASLTNA